MSRIFFVAVLASFALHLTGCSNTESSANPAPGLSSGPRLPDSQTTTDDFDPIKDSDTPDDCGAVHLPPFPEYKPISEIYPEPSALLTIADTASALADLRKIASPTQQYHAELIGLARSAERLDKEHLLLLVRAAYFTSGTVDRIESDLKIQADSRDTESCRRKALARRDLSVLKGYAAFTQMILETGLPKVSDLTWPDALEILKEAMPTGDGSKAFFTVAEKFSPLSEVDLKTLMTFANRKRAAEAAGKLALTWFTTFTEKSIRTLFDANALLDGRSKDAFLLGAIEHFSSFTSEEVKALAKAAHGLAGEIAGRAFTKIDTFSHQAVLDLLNVLEDQHRGEFLAIVIHQYPELTTSELSQLLESTRFRRSSIAPVAASKVSDVAFGNIMSILPLLSGNDRDEWIVVTASRLTSLSAEEAVELLGESRISDGNLALMLLPKVSDLTVENALRMASQLAEAPEKDDFLIQAVDRVTNLDPRNLEDLAKASDSAGDRILAKGKSRMNQI